MYTAVFWLFSCFLSLIQFLFFLHFNDISSFTRILGANVHDASCTYTASRLNNVFLLVIHIQGETSNVVNLQNNMDIFLLNLTARVLAWHYNVDLDDKNDNKILTETFVWLLEFSLFWILSSE